ncbi:hypothetical protein ARMGADRAFT_1076495 [Armillaria gallica]|uniref:Uncharacterized protein n=1 Tax=Armillaria gallica TaxID=47427 RepID=A0A2H3DXZ1_ARMGA|nr:hypothetical protein ARMGADRAFT_1076495 [Armillaria gallica]
MAKLARAKEVANNAEADTRYSRLIEGKMVAAETIVCLASKSSSAFAFQKWRRHKPPSESFRTRFETDGSINQDIIPVEWLAASTRRVPEN